MNPLLCLRVGYMASYDGPGTITSGGKYVTTNGVGGEVFNFKPSRGKCYGYAMSIHHAGIRAELLAPGKSWKPGDELHPVDVVFMARRPSYGQVVVGWYRNATVFHRKYRVRRGKIPGMVEPAREFLCVVDKRQAVLLPEDKRVFLVPSAQTGKQGFPGQSNVWYPTQSMDRPEVSAFVALLRQLMDSSSGIVLPADEVVPTTKPNQSGRASDAAHNTAVERAAVDAAWAHYKGQGFSMSSVEKDCEGWDLEARKDSTLLRVEVKGHSGDTVNFELTPNEYAKLKMHHQTYRVCVVLSALDSPKLFDLVPSSAGGKWRLTDQTGMVVELSERVAAAGAEVAQ